MNHTQAKKPAQAVILAAGMGARLKNLNEGKPKCLLEVGQRTLLDRHIEAARLVGATRILVVAGYGFDQVAQAIPPDVALVYNKRFAETNSLYSLWLTRQWVTDSMLLINGDVIADPRLYQRVAQSPGNALAYDSSSIGESEEMKVRLAEGRVTAISKDLSPDRMSGENVGILKFSRKGARKLLKAAGRLVDSGREQAWAPAAIDSATDHLSVAGVDVLDLAWTEIDFPEDLTHARNHILPLIAGQFPDSNPSCTCNS